VVSKAIPNSIKLDLASKEKENRDHERREKNRGKAHIFRQRKKDYIGSLELKVRELESKVCSLTCEIESYKQREQGLSFDSDYDVFHSPDSYGFESFGTHSKREEPKTIEDLIGDQEKLWFMFNQTSIDESKTEFKNFGKMRMYMKTELLKSDSLNILEKFMLDCDMDPIDINNAFHHDSLTKLNIAMKR
jgi:hypothetical protein